MRVRILKTKKRFGASSSLPDPRILTRTSIRIRILGNYVDADPLSDPVRYGTGTYLPTYRADSNHIRIYLYAGCGWNV